VIPATLLLIFLVVVDLISHAMSFLHRRRVDEELQDLRNRVRDTERTLAAR
jgi:hypothetical protein